MGLKSTTSVLGYQQISSLNTVKSLTVPSKDPVSGAAIRPTLAIIIAETQGVRWRDDGTAPTATVGMPLAVGVPLAYDGPLANIQFIEQTASAILNVSYYN